MQAPHQPAGLACTAAGALVQPDVVPGPSEVEFYQVRHSLAPGLRAVAILERTRATFTPIHCICLLPYMCPTASVAGTQLLAQRVGECWRHGFSVSMAGGEWGLETCLDYTLSELPKEGLELQAVLRIARQGPAPRDCLKSETSIFVPCASYRGLVFALFLHL